MRETLHQLSLALALPISVVAVWVVRGEPAGIPARETATAYRVELADLPLPTRERLRAPGGATDWRAPRVTPEDPTSRRGRRLLPDLAAPSRVDLVLDADAETDVAAPPSPRGAHEPPGAVPRAPLSSLRAAAALVASHRTASIPTTLTAVPAPTASGNSVAKEPAAAALQSSSKPARIAALEAAPGFSHRDLGPVRSRGPVSIPDRFRSLPKLSPIVTGRVGSDEIRRERFEIADDYVPLTPLGQPEDHAFDLSLPVLETAAVPIPVDQEVELSAPAPIFRWQATLPKTLLMIPEPGSALLLAAALGALGAARRSRRRA